MVGYLLFVLIGGFPLFALPMPDAQTCVMNMGAMEKVVKEDVVVGCFDMEKQVLHVRPKAEGERVE